MKKIFLFTLLFLLFITPKTYSDKWQTVGARAMGMGGTGVATATGFAQQYYNPALLATQNNNTHSGNDVTLNFNLEVETTEKVLTAINKLSKIAKEYESVKNEINTDGTLNPKQTDSVFETLSILKDLNQGNCGATADANVGITTKLKKLSVSIRSYLYCGVTSVVDINNISLMTDPSSPTTTTKLIGLDDISIVPSDYQDYVDRLLAMFNKYGLKQNHIYGFTGYNYTPEELARAIINMVMGSGTENIEEMTETIEDTIPDIIDILDQDNPGSYTENETQAIIDAGVFTEFAIGYGHEIYNGIQIGGNLKFIQGQLAKTGFLILPSEDKIEDTIKDSLKETTISNQFGIDLGFLLDINKFIGKEILFSPKLGISARNINSPSFKRPSKPSSSKYSKIHWNSNDYDLERQIRAGTAINPLKNLIIALDVDIFSNNTFVDNFDSQEFALGIEYSLFNKRAFSLPLRAGLNKNVANSKCSTEYTFGFGIYTFGFCMEFAGGFSGSTTTIDNQEIPSTASFAFNLGYTF